MFLGLKEAEDRVNDYNPLMKDFPINELLAANSLEAIEGAVSAIYSHLRKIRTTQYPPQRAIFLVEAISRDLSAQLLKVCCDQCSPLVTVYAYRAQLNSVSGTFCYAVWTPHYQVL